MPGPLARLQDLQLLTRVYHPRSANGVSFHVRPETGNGAAWSAGNGTVAGTTVTMRYDMTSGPPQARIGPSRIVALYFRSSTS